MNMLRGRRRKDESAAETVAMIFVIPVLVILVLALIDVGMMFRARMLVENIGRDAVRGAAADGGILNQRTNTIGMSWEQWALNRLYKEGHCTVGACKEGRLPDVSCYNTNENNVRYYTNKVNVAGDLVTCRIRYPYKPINGELLNSPIGLGMGSLLKEFDMTISARAETGANSSFGVAP